MKRNTTDLPFFGDPRVIVLLFVLTVCSGYFTYKGAVMALNAGLADWAGHAGALVFSIGSSTAIFLLWTAAPRAVSKLETGWMRVTGMCMTMVGCVMVVSLSSWLNVAGIAGDSAQSVHMNRIIASFETALDARYTSALAIRAFQPDLKQAQAKYLARREAEFKGGAYTGRPGPGTVEILLLAISDRFADQDKAIDAELSRMSGAAEQARRELKTMREVASRPGDPARRMENLARQADRLRARLGEIDARGLLSGLQRTLQAMPAEIDLQAITARTKRGAAAQRAALKRLKAELGATVGRLDGALTPLIEAPVPALPEVERLNAVEAVWRYPLQHAPYWAGGIALDFTPTVLLFYAMLIAYARGRRGLFVDAAANLTVRELKTAQHALEILRDSLISHEAVRQTHDELTGGPEDQDGDDV